MSDLTCEDLLSQLSSYIDGETTAATCVEIERHLSTCAHCRVVVDTMRKTVELYHQLPHGALPAETREHLYVALDLADFLPPSPNPPTQP